MNFTLVFICLLIQILILILDLILIRIRAVNPAKDFLPISKVGAI